MRRRKILSAVIVLIGALVAAVVLNQQVVNSVWNGAAGALSAVIPGIGTPSGAGGLRREGGVAVLPVVNTVRGAPGKPDLSNAALERAGTVFPVVEAATTLPHFVQVSINPLAVHVGQVQTLTAVIDDPNPIVSVTAVTKLDHKTVTLRLLPEGAASSSALLPARYGVGRDGKVAILPAPESPIALLTAERAAAGIASAAAAPQSYGAHWTVSDTHNTTYVTEFIAKDSAGNVNTVTLAWSDQCGIPNGGDWTATTCTLSSTDGVDNGYAVIGSGVTLTLNGHVFAFNGGASGYISISGGSIVVGSGELVKTNVYALDADGDGYSADNPSADGGWLLESDSGGPPDPNGSYMCFYNGTAPGACYSDTATGATRRYNFSGSLGDCNDNNANVYPGQTGWFTSATTTNMNLTSGQFDNGGEVNYDYNCDGVESEKNPNVSTLSCTDNPVCGTGGYVCNYSSTGSPGWSGSTVPACGQTATYVEGLCGQPGTYGYYCGLSYETYACSPTLATEQLTQACH